MKISNPLAVTHPVFVFGIVWFGQLISLVGSGLTGFALGVWVYKQTGSVTQFALISLFITLPGILISPLAGVLTDRWNRRWVMIISDTGAAVCTLLIVGLLWLNQLEVWHIYIIRSFSSIFDAFQWPAYSAATTQLIPKKHYGRASGLVQFGNAFAQLIAPVLAGVLFELIKLNGVILIDFLTFLVSLLTLSIVRFPALVKNTAINSSKEKGLFWKELTFGLKYIAGRPGLMGLLIFFAITNYSSGIVQVLITPLVLSFTSASMLGIVLSVAGCGMLAGTLVMSAWGGPKRRIYGILIFTLAQGILLFMGGLTPSVILIGAVAFFYLFCFPVVAGCSQAIWQCKVEHDIQGRVFSIRSMIAMSSMPLAYASAGPLVDFVFKPLLAENGLLSSSVGRIIASGPNQGIGFFFILMGFIIVLATAAGAINKHIRNVEDELPDVLPD